MKYNISDLYNPKFINSWKDYSLKDLAEWLNGRAFRKNDYSDAGYPVIKIAELNRGISSGTQYSNSDNIDLKYKLSRGDLLFSWSGNPKTSIDAHIYEYDKGWLNQHIYRVIPKEIIRKDYCYYVLKYIRPNFEIIASNKQTTGLGHVTKKDLEQIRVRIPELGEQKLIENTLSSLDDKIELNNKINENLEEQAQAIFKHWFVDFESPDENGNPYKSSGGEMVESELGMIPKGWKVVKCGDKFNFVKGKVPKYTDNLSESVMPYLNKGALDGNWEDIRYGYKDTGVYCEPLDVLMMMDGSSSSEIFYGYEGLVGSTLSLIDAEDDNVREILYMYFKAFNNELKNQNTGSAIPHANKDFINNIKLAIPKLDSEFSDISIIFKNIRIQVLSNQQQNEKLAQLRDTLLPKLMSGELRIPLD